MIKIENLNGEVLSKMCKEVSPPKFESIQKKNKLLDGTYHIQTIGEPLKYMEFTVVANELQTEKINLMETKGELLKLIDYNRFFIGFINNKVDWKRLTLGYIDREKRLYEGKISIIVKEEGDIK